MVGDGDLWDEMEDEGIARRVRLGLALGQGDDRYHPALGFPTACVEVRCCKA